ncbi:hypothetical protein F5884DRAFT_71361 [Xylogone sp. PMI_703]|nr:hypothetical protein F5884DRAFT_71361 [Xylogone sp. PMI_703]
MRSSTILFLLLAGSLSHAITADSLKDISHLKTLSSRQQNIPTQQEWDGSVATWKTQDACLLYRDSSLDDLTWCQPKCGQLGKDDIVCINFSNPQDADGVLKSDPQGNQFLLGRCQCKLPTILQEIINDVLLALPDIAAIGCSIFLGSIQQVATWAADFIPEEGEVNAATEAAIEAAKSFSQAGLGGGAFGNWAQAACHTTDDEQAAIAGVFNTLNGVPFFKGGCKKGCSPKGKTPPKNPKTKGPPNVQKTKDSPPKSQDPTHSMAPPKSTPRSKKTACSPRKEPTKSPHKPTETKIPPKTTTKSSHHSSSSSACSSQKVTRLQPKVTKVDSPLPTYSL